MRQLLAVAALLIVFRWVDSFGTLCFADDIDRVPRAYRDVAERVEVGPLNEYRRYTPAQQ